MGHATRTTKLLHLDRRDQEGANRQKRSALAATAAEREYQMVQTIAEYASSLHEKRRGMKKLLSLVEQQAVDAVLIEYPDRLVRFGFSSLQETFRCHIAAICAKYPGCLLLFERLRKIKPKGGSQSRRMNSRVANQLRGKIRQYAGEQAYARCSVVTVEINPHGTSQYCSRCGAKGKRFFLQSGKRIFVKWGNLFWCEQCQYEANADYNASVNTHHSFYHELHWQWHDNKRAKPASPGYRSGESRLSEGHPGKD